LDLVLGKRTHIDADFVQARVDEVVCLVILAADRKVCGIGDAAGHRRTALERAVYPELRGVVAPLGENKMPLVIVVRLRGSNCSIYSIGIEVERKPVIAGTG
jgi:hypothetical protein